MLNLQQLHTFITVVSEGNMTEAANKLFLTQPAVSQQIRNLEESLGTELLLRGTRIAKPTLQGELLFEHSRRILQSAQQAEMAIRTLGSSLNGRLRVGTLNSLGVQLVSPVVGRLLKFNPQVSFQVVFSDEESLIESFFKGDLDAVIVPEGYESKMPSFEKQFLLKEEMWLVASGRETEMAKQIYLSDFKDHSIMWLSGEFLAFEKVLNQKLKEVLEHWHATFDTSNVGTLKRVIETGLGWGFLPSSAVKKQVRAGRLQHIQVKDFEYSTPFYYYIKTNMTKEQKAVADALFFALDSLERV